VVATICAHLLARWLLQQAWAKSAAASLQRRWRRLVGGRQAEANQWDSLDDYEDLGYEALSRELSKTSAAGSSSAAGNGSAGTAASAAGSTHSTASIRTPSPNGSSSNGRSFMASSSWSSAKSSTGEGQPLAQAAPARNPAAAAGASATPVPTARLARRPTAHHSPTHPPLPAVRLQEDIAARILDNQSGETVEWVNMCWRKAWRVYQRGLESWITDLLQPVFDGLVADGSVPGFVQVRRGGWGVQGVWEADQGVCSRRMGGGGWTSAERPPCRAPTPRRRRPTPPHTHPPPWPRLRGRRSSRLWS